MPYQNVTMLPMHRPTFDPPPFDRRALPPGGMLDTWIAADGWPLRRFRLGSGARGRMLFLGGRGDMVEKYIEAMAHWAGQGWQVTSFDWRGQGGSGRLTGDPHVGHVPDFAVMVEDLAAFGEAWREEGRREEGGRHVIVAHSMGGHVVLRTMTEGRLTVDAAALVAPMLGLNTAPIPVAVAPWIAKAMCAIGLSECGAWRDDPASPLRQVRLTHSLERLDDELWWRAREPGLYMGAPSWGWLDQAFRSMRALDRAPALAAMTVPTLVLAARADRLVSLSAIRRMTARLPDAALHVYGPDAAHEILREEDGVRLDALRRIDGFLDARAGLA
jgi:lysophospholipase